MSTIVIIDHGVVGDRAVERRVLESEGHEVLDTQALGLSVEEAFDLAVEQDAVAILAGPILPLDRDHLERLDRCRAVVRYGVGLDNVDVDAAQELGIAVGNVPEYGHEEISNHAIALLLALARKLPAFDAAVRRGGTDIPAPQSVRRLSHEHARARRARAHRPARGGEGARVRADRRRPRPVRDAPRPASSCSSSTSCSRARTSSRCTSRSRPRPAT